MVIWSRCPSACQIIIWSGCYPKTVLPGNSGYDVVMRTSVLWSACEPKTTLPRDRVYRATIATVVTCPECRTGVASERRHAASVCVGWLFRQTVKRKVYCYGDGGYLVGLCTRCAVRVAPLGQSAWQMVAMGSESVSEWRHGVRVCVRAAPWRQSVGQRCHGVRVRVRWLPVGQNACQMVAMVSECVSDGCNWIRARVRRLSWCQSACHGVRA